MKKKDYIGKTILVGIRYMDQNDKLVQYYGIISKISKQGIIIKLEDGTDFKVPPVLSMIEPAEPGTYRLHCSGETIENPDFVSTWAVSKKPQPNYDYLKL